MKTQLLLFGMAAALATASPLTITFSGVGSGSVGSDTFTNDSFTFTFTTDTTLLKLGTPSEPTDWVTPSGTPATFNIMNIGTGIFVGDQSIFVHDSEERVGIWHYDSTDWLTDTSSAFDTYDLHSSIGPLSSGSPTALPTSSGEFNGFNVEMGGVMTTLNVSSVSSLTFAAVVTPNAPPSGPGSTAAPEPSTVSLACIGLAGLIVGAARRRRRAH